MKIVDNKKSDYNYTDKLEIIQYKGALSFFNEFGASKTEEAKEGFKEAYSELKKVHPDIFELKRGLEIIDEAASDYKKYYKAGNGWNRAD